MARSKQFTFETYVIAMILGTLDMILIAPVLPLIMKEYGLPIHWTVWVIALYMAFFSFSLPVMENWAQNSGRTKVFLLSVALMVMGTFLSALSKQWVWFMWGRVIQSVGAGGMVPYVSSQSRRMLSKLTRTRQWIALLSLGLFLTMMPLLTVAVTYLLGWRAIFLIHLVFVLFLSILAKNRQVADKPRQVKGASGESILFFGLIILFAMTAVTTTDFLEGLRAFLDPHVLPLWIVALGMVVPLFMVERQESYPFFELHLFAEWRLLLLYVQVGLSGFIWMALVLVPDWVARLYRLSFWGVGFILCFVLFCSLFAVPMVQSLARRWDFKKISSLGFLLATVSYAALAWINGGAWFFVALGILGVSLSFALAAPVHHFLFEWVSARRIRNGLMALGMFRAAGGALGLTTMSRIFSSLDPSLASWFVVDPATEHLVRLAEQKVMLFAAAASFVGFIVSVWLPLKSEKR